MFRIDRHRHEPGKRGECGEYAAELAQSHVFFIYIKMRLDEEYIQVIDNSRGSGEAFYKAMRSITLLASVWARNRLVHFGMPH